jgi:two-component system, sensor histidine kinase and response regulator
MIFRRTLLPWAAIALAAALSCILGLALATRQYPIALVTIAAGAISVYSFRRGRGELTRLRETLHHLTSSSQAAGISAWEWDVASNRIEFAAGSAMELQLGGASTMDRSEFQGKLVHPADREPMQLAFRSIIDSPPGGLDRFVQRYRRMLPDGGMIHVEIHARAVRDAQGRVRRFIGMSRDVTAEVETRRSLEQQAERLREAERRVERASRSSLEGHWELDYVARTRWHSSSFQALLGHPPRESVAGFEEAVQHTHPDDLAEASAALERNLQSGEPIDFKVRLETADGSYRWFRMRGGAERDAEGRPLRVSGSAQDIHQQKLAEDALREVQARFERAVHGTEDGLWEIDLSGPRGRFWLSPRLHELLGFEPGELSDDQEVLRDLIHPDDQPISDAAVQQQLSEGVPLDVEVRMRTKSGAYRWYRLRGRPGYDALGRVVRTSGSMQDVTEARASREALVRATEAAQAASRAKSAFLATMSHEIRTPMNGIIGMTALLLDSVLGRVQREYAEAIRTSANSLLSIINDILDFSKIEAGKLEIESLEMDLWGQVEEVGSLMALQAAMKSLELVVDVAPDVPQTVLGDPQRIRQCLVNLVGNAIKFTTTGEIVIAVRRAAQREGVAHVRFEVRDTGIGVGPQVRSELFKPFTQADSSTTRKFGGTGLGLSIVKRLVELMGGEVGLESEVGRGSTFWFALPLKPIESSGRSARPLFDGSAARVLVVDDNATNRRVLAGHLAAGPFQVQAVESAAQALAQLEEARGAGRDFDVVLIDYQMPGMDGAMLGERISSDPRFSRSRLVLLTSLDRKGDHTRFASMGFAAYLTKPIRPRELRDCLSHVLAHGPEEWSARTHPLITRGTLVASAAVAQTYGGRVLVVEDNLVNQKVAQKFLERLGCSVRVASDGAEAVEITAREPFDLILMDMQMPVMDGLEATRAIRAKESGGARTPIVALTANVLAGQFQSCLDAGMDDVLAKPLDASRLKDVLDRFVIKAPAAAAPVPLPSQGPSLASPPLDLARLAGLAGDDAAFMRELLATFRASAAAVLGELREALQALDRDRLRRSAHKLRGASDNIGATRLRELAALVESEAAALAGEDLQRTVEAIAAELAALDGFFSTADPATFSRQLAS